jgi:hypothetical protein
MSHAFWRPSILVNFAMLVSNELEAAVDVMVDLRFSRTFRFLYLCLFVCYVSFAPLVPFYDSVTIAAQSQSLWQL